MGGDVAAELRQSVIHASLVAYGAVMPLVEKNMVLFKPGAELRQIVNAVNEIGASPTALISILEALQRAGALRAELIVI